MKVWLDDRHAPPDGNWVWVTTPAEVTTLLELDEVKELSLDHDLGLVNTDGREQTGYDVLLWIEKWVVIARLTPPRLAVHSANPRATERMQRAIDSIYRLAARH